MLSGLANCGYASTAMAKTVIVSESTARDLLEAHASLSAWYYQLTAALRAAKGAIQTPDEAARAAFAARLATDFPELAEVAKTIRVPRPFVPQPPSLAARPLEAPSGDEPTTVMEPARARLRRDESDKPAPGGGGSSSRHGEGEPDETG